MQSPSSGWADFHSHFLRLDFALILYVCRKSVKRALSVEPLFARALAWLTRRGKTVVAVNNQQTVSLGAGPAVL
jgi:hypothetical protein